MTHRWAVVSPRDRESYRECLNCGLTDPPCPPEGHDLDKGLYVGGGMVEYRCRRCGETFLIADHPEKAQP